jgi:hypothetical protein
MGECSLISRYEIPKPLPLERINRMCGLPFHGQPIWIEIMPDKRRRIRLWVSYDYAREHGSYTDVYFDGMIESVTVYPSGRAVKKLNRPADRKRAHNYRRVYAGLKRGTKS